MKLLLDTHAFIWAIAQPRLLSRRVAALIADSANVVLISAVSVYEIEFKVTIRRRPQAAYSGLVHRFSSWGPAL